MCILKLLNVYGKMSCIWLKNTTLNCHFPFIPVLVIIFLSHFYMVSSSFTPHCLCTISAKANWHLSIVKIDWKCLRDIQWFAQHILRNAGIDHWPHRVGVRVTERIISGTRYRGRNGRGLQSRQASMRRWYLSKGLKEGREWALWNFGEHQSRKKEQLVQSL